MAKDKRRRGPATDKDAEGMDDAALSRLFSGAKAFLKPQRLGADNPDEFVLNREAGGLRHYLAGEPVHAGDIIEALTGYGASIAGPLRVDLSPGA